MNEGLKSARIGRWRGRWPDSIRARLCLLSAIALLPGLVLLGGSYFQRYHTRRNQILTSELEVAQSVALAFKTYVHTVWRHNHVFGQAVLTFGIVNEASNTRVLDTMVAEYPSIRNMSWASPEGRILVSSSPGLSGADLAARAYFQKIRAGASDVIGELRPLGALTPRPTLAIASALRDEHHQLLGVVVAGIEPTRLGELMLEARQTEGSLYALYDPQGTLVHCSSVSNLSWEMRLHWQQTDLLLRQALETLESQTGVSVTKSSRGQWILAHVPIPELGWVASAGRPMASAMAPVRRDMMEDSFWAALVVVGTIGMAFLIARSISGPLLRLEREAAHLGAGARALSGDPRAPVEIHNLRETVQRMAAGLLERTQALQASETELRIIFDKAGVGIYEVMGDDRVVKVNECACQILGRSRDEILRMNVHELTAPEDRALSDAMNAKIHEGFKDRIAYEKRYLRGDGSRIWGHVTVSGIRNGDVRWLRSIVTLEDISERKHAEGEVKRLTAELEERVEQRTAELAAANRELEAFTYSVSHDLRSPLRHINGYIRLLEEEAGESLAPATRNYLNIVINETRRMHELIEDLLLFSRLGRAALSKSPVALSQVAEEVRQDLAAEAEGRAVEWRIGPLPAVWGDATLLRSVLVNLMGNALKYTRGRSPAVIEMGARETPTEWVFYIKDNGAGFDMRYAGKLFGVFQRLHSDAQFEGTGMGLASVRRIIERHGGRVWAEAEIDRGATFYVALPGTKPGAADAPGRNS